MSVTREHVRMNDVKRLFPMECFGNRQRGAIEQPAAYRLFACVAQRQAAREIHGNTVDYILLGRPPIRFGKRRTELLHHRRHADAGDDRHIVSLCAQSLRLLMNIEAIRRMIRLPMNHHQDPHAGHLPSKENARSSVRHPAKKLSFLNLPFSSIVLQETEALLVPVWGLV